MSKEYDSDDYNDDVDGDDQPKKNTVKSGNTQPILSESDGSDTESDADASKTDDNSDDESLSDDESDNEDKSKKIFTTNPGSNTERYNLDDFDTEDEDDGDDEMDENYLQKFDETVKQNIISEYHPEMQQLNYSEVEVLTTIKRNDNGEIIDPLHKTLPFLTKFEKARVLGERAKQINDGANHSFLLKWR